MLSALDGLEVPCDPSVFKRRWAERGTASALSADAEGATSRLPLELATSRDAPEEALLRALANIGVVEFRTASRINMPDIFRVEAGIKRRGGVRPPYFPALVNIPLAWQTRASLGIGVAPQGRALPNNLRRNRPVDPAGPDSPANGNLTPPPATPRSCPAAGAGPAAWCRSRRTPPPAPSPDRPTSHGWSAR